MGYQGFWTQFYALCWKNRVLKLRHWSTLALELALPTIIILALWGVLQVIKPTVSKESIPDRPQYFSYLNNLGGNPPCQFYPYSNLLWDCQQTTSCPQQQWQVSEQDIFGIGCRRSYIAVAPESADNADAAAAAAEFVMWAEADPTKSANGNLTDATYKLFSSEGELTNHIMDPLYVIKADGFLVSSAIVFLSGAPNWEYVLRFNQSVVPSTTLPDVDNSVKFTTQFICTSTSTLVIFLFF
jgi:hypothetical protein